ncbi:MAG: CDP-alcohol phosphatidyltransferase family protein [Bacteroidales bacterium]|nr:CDP-alcohol phosphatidyltransferase family protein [Bacteroidales bacterium]
MERKQSVRIQTSILNEGEKKVLVWLAKRQPKWVTSDFLTAVGLIGAFLVGLGYALCWLNPNFLWLSSFGLFLNWYGDSLDGTLARVRNTQRPLYGFFIDHNVDGIAMTMICLGAGLSPYIHIGLALMVLAVYLLLCIYVYISAHLRGEFKLTYGNLGPTEFRVVLFIFNLIFLYVTPLRTFQGHLNVFGADFCFGTFDIIAAIVLVVLIVMHISSLLSDGKKYADEDPIPGNGEGPFGLR